MRGDAIYEARGLTLSFGTNQAFGPASFEIREGERLVLVGPNGSGKTTLLKALNGLVAPSAGSLSFLGEELGRSKALRERSVYLHQHTYVMAGSVAYNVSFGARARGFGRNEVEARAADAMALLGLEGLGRRRHRALSGGEAQRVGLARALAAGADVLLLDEPTASADSGSRELILAALRSRRGSTMVIATHDGEFATGLADRVFRLERGSIVEITETAASARAEAPAGDGAPSAKARFLR